MRKADAADVADSLRDHPFLKKIDKSGVIIANLRTNSLIVSGNAKFVTECEALAGVIDGRPNESPIENARPIPGALIEETVIGAPSGSEEESSEAQPAFESRDVEETATTAEAPRPEYRLNNTEYTELDPKPSNPQIS